MVYFIKASHGPVKIGYVENETRLQQRLRNLQCGNARELEIVAFSRRAGRKMEKELHRRFAHARIRGEWFRPDQTMRALIERVASSPDEPIRVPARGHKLTDRQTRAKERRKREKEAIEQIKSRQDP